MKNHFDLQLYLDGDRVRVTGYITPHQPATRETPADGGEIEDFCIYAYDGSEIEDADGDICEQLSDAIYEAVSDAIVADYADAAEARRDREMDR